MFGSCLWKKKRKKSSVDLKKEKVSFSLDHGKKGIKDTPPTQIAQGKQMPPDSPHPLRRLKCQLGFGLLQFMSEPSAGLMYIWRTIECSCCSLRPAVHVPSHHVCSGMLLETRLALWCTKMRRKRGREEREADSLTVYLVPPKVMLFCLKQAVEVRQAHVELLSVVFQAAVKVPLFKKIFGWVGGWGECYILCLYTWTIREKKCIHAKAFRIIVPLSLNNQLPKAHIPKLLQNIAYRLFFYLFPVYRQ